MCESIPFPNEFDDSNDFWSHPIYDRYEANREGVVLNIKNKRDIGWLEKMGYIRIGVKDGGIQKKLSKTSIYF